MSHQGPCKEGRESLRIPAIILVDNWSETFVFTHSPFPHAQCSLRPPTRNIDSSASKTVRIYPVAYHVRVGRAGRKSGLSLDLQISHEKGLNA